MKYSILLGNFQQLGRYHALLAIACNLSMILSFYIILTISVEQTSPIAYCKNPNGDFQKCDISNICGRSIEDYYIDYQNSISNWKLQFGLICGNEKYFSYLSSMIFSVAIFSSLLMSVVSDKMGRKFIFRLEVLANIVSFLIMYYGNSIVCIFVAVFINELFSHIFNTSMLYLYEYFPQGYYVLIMSLHNVFYGVLGLIVSAYVDTYKETSSLILVMITLGFLVMIFNFTILTESPGWRLNMIEKGVNREENIKQLRKDYKSLCAINGEDVADRLEVFDRNLLTIEMLTHKENSDEKKASAFSFITEHLKDKTYLKHFGFALYLWLVNQIMFYSILINLDVFGKHIEGAYRSFFICFIFSNILVGLISGKLGFRNILLYVPLLIPVTLIFLILNFTNIIELSASTEYFIFVTFEFITIFLIESIYIYIPQLFPANIRSISVAYTKIPAKLILILSPFLIGSNVVVMCYVFAILTLILPVLTFICY
jgi:hypothetical protein